MMHTVYIYGEGRATEKVFESPVLTFALHMRDVYIRQGEQVMVKSDPTR